MKKALCVVLALAMLLAMASCGTSATVSPSTAQSPTSSAPVSQTPTPDPSPSSKYNEAPELKTLADKGELPSVEERLPLEPMVSEASEIGQYGGNYVGAAFGPTSGQLDTEALRFVGLVTIEPDLQTFKPNLLLDYKISDDGREYTYYLREGLKWSSGDPLNADDFMFWAEDILANEELNPAPMSEFKSGGELLKYTKVNDYEVKVTFKDPNPAYIIIMARYHTNKLRYFYAPKEYLKQWHPKYNPDAEKLAKEEGFESWVLCFQFHSDNSQAAMDVNAPDISPWVLTSIDSTGSKHFTRNPYYHTVDREGNQLPYIDSQTALIVQDGDVRNLKIFSGEILAAAENPLPLSNYTLYKENESKGGYKTYLFTNTRGSDCAFTFNLTHNDPVVRQVFNEVKFREAMSLAIDRKAINDTLYFSNAVIRQAVPPMSTSFFEDWMESYMAGYDVAGANSRLDELGYAWDSTKTTRLMPDGRPFNLKLETIEEFVKVSEMVAEFWSAIGIKTTLQVDERSFYEERASTNDREISAFTLDMVAETNLRAQSFGRFRPGNAQKELEFMSKYTLWFNGQQGGEEPPQEIKTLRDKCLEFGTLSPENAKYKTLGGEIASEVVKNLWFIGCTVAPRIVIVSDKLGNTPTKGTFANDYTFWKPYKCDAWYFK